MNFLFCTIMGVLPRHLKSLDRMKLVCLEHQANVGYRSFIVCLLGTANRFVNCSILVFTKREFSYMLSLSKKGGVVVEGGEFSWTTLH